MAKKKTTKRTQQMLTVNDARHAALEAVARARRKKTGDAITWQDVANEAIDKFTR